MAFCDFEFSRSQLINIHEKIGTIEKSPDNRGSTVLDFSLARDISFYEYEVHRSAVKRDSVHPHAGLPEIYCRFGR